MALPSLFSRAHKVFWSLLWNFHLLSVRALETHSPSIKLTDLVQLSLPLFSLFSDKISPQMSLSTFVFLLSNSQSLDFLLLCKVFNVIVDNKTNLLKLQCIIMKWNSWSQLIKKSTSFLRLQADGAKRQQQRSCLLFQYGWYGFFLLSFQFLSQVLRRLPENIFQTPKSPNPEGVLVQTFRILRSKTMLKVLPQAFLQNFRPTWFFLPKLFKISITISVRLVLKVLFGERVDWYTKQMLFKISNCTISDLFIQLEKLCWAKTGQKDWFSLFSFADCFTSLGKNVLNPYRRKLKKPNRSTTSIFSQTSRKYSEVLLGR